MNTRPFVPLGQESLVRGTTSFRPPTNRHSGERTPRSGARHQAELVQPRHAGREVLVAARLEGLPGVRQRLLVVAAGDARVDNRKFKDTFHMKPTMLPHDDVERLIGHAVGGVCPFGRNEGVPVYIDVSVKRFKTVFPAVGSDNSAIELSVDELYKYSEAEGWVDVCKLPEAQA